MVPRDLLTTEDQIFSERSGLASGADPVLATERDEHADLAAYRRGRRRARTLDACLRALLLPADPAGDGEP